MPYKRDEYARLFRRYCNLPQLVLEKSTWGSAVGKNGPKVRNSTTPILSIYLCVYLPIYLWYMVYGLWCLSFLPSHLSLFPSHPTLAQRFMQTLSNKQTQTNKQTFLYVQVTAAQRHEEAARHLFDWEFGDFREVRTRCGDACGGRMEWRE